MTLEAVVFYALSAVTVGFSLMVVLLRNPITSVLSLVISFFGLSGIYILLHAPFLGVVQILIYAGAILVLFLYVTMLLSLKGLESSGSVDRIKRVLSMALALGLFISLAFLLRPALIGVGSVGDDFGSLESVGKSLLGPNALLFELLSLVLLVGMIGTVLLNLKKKAEL